MFSSSPRFVGIWQAEEKPRRAAGRAFRSNFYKASHPHFSFYRAGQNVLGRVTGAGGAAARGGARDRARLARGNQWRSRQWLYPGFAADIEQGTAARNLSPNKCRPDTRERGR